MTREQATPLPVQRWEHYINGASHAPASGNQIDAFVPCASAAADRVASGTAADVYLAARAAAAEAPAWRDRRPIKRERIMLIVDFSAWNTENLV